MSEQQYQNTTGVKTNTFSKGMVKDVNETYSGEGVWTNAINAANNSHDGEMLVLGNEPANRFVTTVPYTLIGAIPLTGDKWVLFSTDDYNSEIGVFDDSEGKYVKTVNDPGLGFKRSHLITGAAKKNHDCTWSVYFADGLNPDRCLNLDKVPYKEKPRIDTGEECYVPQYTNELDVEALRIAHLLKTPKLNLRKAIAGGSLPNGSYQVVPAYTVNGVRVTDYFLPSNIQSLFDHRNMSGALEVEVEEIDTEFDEFELVLISTVNQQVQAKRIGTYSTRQKTIMIDQVRESLPTVPIETIPVQTPAFDKSDAIYQVNDHLLRIGPYTKPDFNYQPLANQIRAKWVALEVPANYYTKGGNAVGYLRDEVYAFFIRWVYNTGEKSADYPIVGREPDGRDLGNASGADVFEAQLKLTDKPMKVWQVENTARVTSTKIYDVPEGKVIMEGTMGYWESTEKYPDDKPAIWGDLCGKPIRHHRMPDNDLVPLTSADGRKIVILGVQFDNIQHPVDNQGNPIKSIVGYEIMRASREGNRSIVAKGILNNAGQFNLPDEAGDVNASKDVILGRASNAERTGRVGLYPNFPFNDLNPNPFLSQDEVKGGCGHKGFRPLDQFRKDVFTFHSPETQFRNPFLSATELKIHGEIFGQVKGQFEPVYKHPKHKLIRDFALIIAGMAGVGTGLLAIRGKRTTTTVSARSQYVNILKTTVTDGGTVINNPVGAALGTGGQTALNIAKAALKAALATIPTLPGVEAALDKALEKVQKLSTDLPPKTGHGFAGEIHETKEETAVSNLPLPVRILGGAHLFTYYFSMGTDEALRIIRNMVPYQQYAYQYNSHGFYNQFQVAKMGQRRRYIKDAVYLEPYMQEFAGQFKVNNLFRSRQVMLQIHRDLAAPTIKDNSRVTIGDLRQWDNPTKPFLRTTSAYYASLKVPLKAQYGQIESCVILPVSTGTSKTYADKEARFVSPVLFGGDVYINRYTEKNSAPLFNEWMFDYADGTEWNYRSHYNLPYPTYWMDSTKYEVTNLTSALIRFNFRDNVLPNDFAHLDRPSNDCKKKASFVIDKAYFYLFVNGVRDFFVESELNMAHRDWGEKLEERHYDPNGFTDLKELFRSDIIKSGNHFKYDLSLSASRLVHNFVSWGSVLPRDFDPLVSERCYQHYPKRIIYSLPQQEELKKDNWKVYLANNYKDFGSRITSVHQIDQSGAMIFFEDRSPVQFVGVDQLQTEAGIKLTVGDGGLFAQPPSPIVAADKHYEYGACQNRLGIINTPAGLFWISQRQGKIFQYAGGLKPISNDGLQFWFNEYLPSQLMKQFPDFELYDNPVMGIGCQAVYDSFSNVVYFSKKDYKVRDQYLSRITYKGGDIFLLDGRTKITLGDSEYFEDASWTISYDVKTQTWISFHDWKPDYILPSSVHFYTVKGGELWKHNDRTDLFCNFYGVDYPFEVEFPVTTGQDVATLRNVEYQLECFRYLNGGRNRQHLLDFNFDRAMIFNSEQHSGMLRLTPRPKNNPFLMVTNPQISNNGVDTYFSKEENKYRINQFFDLTKNRGEYQDNLNGMWLHEANGYRKQLNPAYVSYSKTPLERKKFRHYANHVLLRRVRCEDTKMLLKVANTKNLKSPR